MKYEEKKKRWNYWWGFSPLSPRASQSLTKIGYHRYSKCKEKAIWEGKSLALWIRLTRYASANTKSFYNNNWEIKFLVSTLGASRASRVFFFTVRAWIFFFLDSELMQDSFLTYMHFQDVQCLYIFSKSPSPSPHQSHPPPPQKWSARQTVETCVFFPTSHIPLSRNMCFTYHSVVIFSRQMHVAFSLHKECCHLCRINANR